MDPVNEMVRFTFKGQMIRITQESGFERCGEKDEWATITDMVDVFGTDVKVSVVLDTLLGCCAIFDNVEENMGKQMFLAAMRIPGMIALGFGDAVLN